MWLALLALASAEEPRRHIEVTVGDSVDLKPFRVPSSIAVTDPDIVVVASLRFCCRLYGLRPGTTDILLQYGVAGLYELIDVTVVRDLTRLQRTVSSLAETGHLPERGAVEQGLRPVLELPLGATVDLDLGRPFTLARVTAPDICALTSDGTHLQLTGRHVGETDLLVERDGEILLIDLVVQRDIGGLQQLVGELAP